MKLRFFVCTCLYFFLFVYWLVGLFLFVVDDDDGDDNNSTVLGEQIETDEAGSLNETLTFLCCVLLNVSSKCFHKRMHNHIGCICSTFLHCAF